MYVVETLCVTTRRLTDNCQVKSDSDKAQNAKVVVALGDDFESANAAVMYFARDIVMGSKATSGELQKEVEALKTGDETTKLWQENWYDGLSYCEWAPPSSYHDLKFD